MTMGDTGQAPRTVVTIDTMISAAALVTHLRNMIMTRGREAVPQDQRLRRARQVTAVIIGEGQRLRVVVEVREMRCGLCSGLLTKKVSGLMKLRQSDAEASADQPSSETGQLTEKELGTALVNGDYTSFDPHTVKMMIR